MPDRQVDVKADLALPYNSVLPNHHFGGGVVLLISQVSFSVSLFTSLILQHQVGDLLKGAVVLPVVLGPGCAEESDEP